MGIHGSRQLPPSSKNKMLNLPIPDDRMMKGKFQNLQVKLRKRLFAFDVHSTPTGKEVFIRSIAPSIPTYLMCVLNFRWELCDDLNQMVRNYYCGAEKGKRKKHWYLWDKMTRPKSVGA